MDKDIILGILTKVSSRRLQDMITIKNSAQLKKLVNKDKDLFLKEEDVRIEYQVEKGELRNVYCRDLFLMNDSERFDFNGGDFNGWDFNGWNFNGWNFNGGDFNGWNFNGWNFNGWNFNGGNFTGWDFNGRNFNGWDFNGGNFTGWNFTGKKVSYHAFFNCYGSIKCESIERKREPHAEPVALDGTIEIIPEISQGKIVKIKVADGQIITGEIVD